MREEPPFEGWRKDVMMFLVLKRAYYSSRDDALLKTLYDEGYGTEQAARVIAERSK